MMPVWLAGIDESWAGTAGHRRRHGWCCLASQLPP
jgi:hypothetical protein